MKNQIALLLLCIFTPLISLADGKGVADKREEIKTVVFAGGCFWCLQPPFDALKGKGVLSTSVGYSGGHTEAPTYEKTTAGGTGHFEVIQVTYDDKKVKLQDLLSIFWRNIDPFDAKGQFCDKGDTYLSAVFYANNVEKKEIEKSISALKEQGIRTEQIVTKVLPRKIFYPAEDYHQSYYLKNPIRYKYYRSSCGRDARLKEVWGSSPAAKPQS